MGLLEPVSCSLTAANLGWNVRHRQQAWAQHCLGEPSPLLGTSGPFCGSNRRRHLNFWLTDSWRSYHRLVREGGNMRSE
ncbi:hypothetical protein DPMN_093889 [Dreissena polymorpha]|uniref:Uncharacterized protein n=1 Tax=Dreissena polymorpha TaxID=45954 RepID=A0A9D4L439_DREPO|nr:hypothetical protein DPMN_093889 [Dreissena polymorpha]